MKNHGIKNAFFFPEMRYTQLKRDLDKELGIKRY